MDGTTNLSLRLVSIHPGTMIPVSKPNRNGTLQPAGTMELHTGLRVLLSDERSLPHRKRGRRTERVSVYELVDMPGEVYVTAQTINEMKREGIILFPV